MFGFLVSFLTLTFAFALPFSQGKYFAAGGQVPKPIDIAALLEERTLDGASKVVSTKELVNLDLPTSEQDDEQNNGDEIGNRQESEHKPDTTKVEVAHSSSGQTVTVAAVVVEKSPVLEETPPVPPLNCIPPPPCLYTEPRCLMMIPDDVNWCPPPEEEECKISEVCGVVSSEPPVEIEPEPVVTPEPIPVNPPIPISPPNPCSVNKEAIAPNSSMPCVE